MTQKMKTIIGIVIFAAVIAGATITYNILSENVEAENNIGAATEQAEEDVAANEGQDDVTVVEDEGAVEDDVDKYLAPDFAMQDQDGNIVKLSEVIANGKPIVLNFWASWCPPCKGEMPDFDKVYKEMGDEVQFMMVDLTDGQQETVELGTQYIEEQGFSFPVFFDVNQEGAMSYGIHSIPTTIFIDAEGNTITHAQGAIDEETLRRGIDMIRE